MLTVQQYIEKYKMSLSTFYRKIESGEIPQKNIGKKINKNGITFKMMLKDKAPISKYEVKDK